jgi:hypothetical protein
MTEAALSQPGTAISEREDAQAAVAAPSFPDVVWAHYEWDAQRRAGGDVDPALKQRYRRTLAEFQQQHGELVSVYWSRADASAVGLTVKALGPLSFGDAKVEFHRATDWVTRGTPAIPEALDHCETLSRKVREVLRSTSERIAMQWIFSVAAHLLGFVERTGGKPEEHEARKVAHEARLELHRIEKYYDRAGMKAGRIVYAQGMLFGVAFLIVFAFLAAGVLWLFGAYDAHSSDIQRFFACYAAGALGALVSVMSRMASERNKIVVDYEVGRSNLLLLGAFRPFVGSIFGLALYFAVRGGLLQINPKDENSFYWYTALSFLAGFSERFTKVLIDSAEGTVEGGLTTHGGAAASHRPESEVAEQRQPAAAPK